MSKPSRTSPKTTWCPLSHGVDLNVMKNCDPLVFGPELAIESKNGLSWVSLKFSSLKDWAKIDSPPVPSP